MGRPSPSPHCLPGRRPGRLLSDSSPHPPLPPHSLNPDVPMDSISESTASLLERHPAPALTLEELRTLVQGGHKASSTGGETLLRELRRRPDLLRILELPPRRWAGAGPRAWIMSRRPGAREAHRALPGILRTCLRHLAEQVDPASALALARWERLVREEGRVRLALSRRRTPPAGSFDP